VGTEEGLLRITGITKRFNGLLTLDSFDLCLPPNRITAIIGPNGAGKSTLFHIASGSLRPDSGTVFFRDKDLTRLAPYKIARLGVARTFQDMRLIQQMSVLDNVLLATSSPDCEGLLALLRIRYVRQQESINRKRALEWLDYVRLVDKCNDLAGEISYGQQKLLSLACCLATGSELLLLDEPVAGVSPTTAEHLLEHIIQLPSIGKTVLFIEHNIVAVQSVADRVIVIDEGRKIAEGTWNEVSCANEVLEAYLA